MPYLKSLDLPADQLVTVFVTAAETSRMMHGNRVYATLEARARAEAGKRGITGDYTSSVDPQTGAYTATFVLQAD